MNFETSAVLKPYSKATRDFTAAGPPRSQSTLAKAPPAVLSVESSGHKSPFDMMKGISNNLAQGSRYQGLRAQAQVNKNRKVLNTALAGKSMSIGSNAELGQAIGGDYGQQRQGSVASHERSISVD